MAVREIAWRNFQGGLNIRDAPSELAENQFVDAMNITVDERGALWKRKGMLQRWPAFGASAKVSNIFDWASRGFVVTQIGAGMHVNNNAAFLTWSTADRCGMTEFNGNLMLIHPVDGFRIYDGTTVTGPFTNSPKGDCLATWQNKVFANDVINPSRVSWCAAGTPGTWNVNDWVELREVNSGKIVCLKGAGGVDISGRPGLLAFKEDAAHRMHDSATGAYVTIDASTGAGSALSAVSAFGRTYVINDRGIFYTDGNRSMQKVSDLVDPFFSSTYINTSRSDLMAAGRYQDKLFFSLPGAGLTANSLALELSPTGEWIVPHSNAASAYGTLAHGAGLLIGSPSTNGLVLDSHTGGSDNGSAISSYFQTRWLEPNAGNKCRIRRLRFIGKGQFTATVFKDYQDTADTASRNVSIQTTGILYDNGALYDAPTSLYAALGFQAPEDEHSWGVAQAISVRIEESSSLTQIQRPFLGSSVSPVTGAWNLTQINMRAIDLGEV